MEDSYGVALGTDFVFYRNVSLEILSFFCLQMFACLLVRYVLDVSIPLNSSNPTKFQTLDCSVSAIKFL